MTSLYRPSDHPDDQPFPGGFHHFLRDEVQLVNLQNPFDLGEEPLQQAEIPARDPDDGSTRFSIGEFRGMKCQAKLGPLLRQDKLELIAAQRSELMDEADAGVELGIPGWR